MQQTSQLFKQALHALEINNSKQAISLLKKIVNHDATIAEAWYNLAKAYIAADNRAKAQKALAKANQLTRSSADAQNSIGLLYLKLKAFDMAEQCFQQAIKLQPDFAFAHANLALLCVHRQKLDIAQEHMRQALALQPNDAGIQANLSALKNAQRDYVAAEAAARCALKQNNTHSQAWFNLGFSLFYQFKYDEAGKALQATLTYDSKDDAALYYLAQILGELKRHKEGLECIKRAIALNKEAVKYLGVKIGQQLKICDWSGDFISTRKTLLNQIKCQKEACVPLTLHALSDDQKLNYTLAQIYASDKYPVDLSLPAILQKADSERIKVGYFSADFGNHPVSHLLAKVLELHDLNAFDVYAFSLRDRKDEMKEKLLSILGGRFIDVSEFSAKEIALLAREYGIDIAVDLGGYTSRSRTEIFAYRAAPIQINYLGFAGTMGVEYMDYIIADQVVIPREFRQFYSEKIIYLPDCHQPNDSTKQISTELATRNDSGLPENRIVYCCFNNPHKIIPEIFDQWMNVLKGVEDSVLWLFDTNPDVISNLRKEASIRGVDPERIIFAKRVESLADHLARIQLADLFLDTFPYNACTTASDALWAGLPLLTRNGQSMVSRMASSLLSALNLPELITDNSDDYVNKAIEFGNHPERLKAIREKLAANKKTSSLFDSEVYARRLEKAYQTIYERYQSGLAPDSILIEE